MLTKDHCVGCHHADNGQGASNVKACDTRASETRVDAGAHRRPFISDGGANSSHTGTLCGNLRAGWGSDEDILIVLDSRRRAGGHLPWKVTAPSLLRGSLAPKQDSLKNARGRSPVASALVITATHATQAARVR